jgi:hypothetical protein
VTASAAQLADTIRTFDNKFNHLRRDSVRQLGAAMSESFRIRETLPPFAVWKRSI